MVRAQKDNYFRAPSLIWFILIPIGVLLTPFAHIQPDVLPWNYMFWPIGPLTRFLVVEYPGVIAAIFYSMWLVHFVEAVFAYRIAKSKNLSNVGAWVLQTLLYGYFSLRHLRAYKPKSE